MNYEDAIKFIHSTHKFGIKLGLENIRYLLELMNSPQDKLQYVHVAGTNGKGSTVSFISSILIEAGYKVGIFTSPYIERFTERIKINNEEISKEDLAAITENVKEKIELMINAGYNHPTEFEIVTSIAFEYFNMKNCDIVILEVGLGGRFDSTNIIKNPLVSVITSIGYDHMNILGDTLEKIAIEKAGIIKENSEVILYPNSSEVERVIENKCKETESPLIKVDFEDIIIENTGIEGQTFSYKLLKDLEVTLIGEHQVKNSILAIETAELLKNKGFKIDYDIIRSGLKKAKWNGRFEILNKEPVFIIDGAHNIDGVNTLYDTLTRYFKDKKIIFIIGMMRDKDYKNVIKKIYSLAKCFIVVTPDNERALSAQEFALFIKDYCKNVYISGTIESAVKLSLEISLKDDVICSFGSLYYIGDVRKYFI